MPNQPEQLNAALIVTISVLQTQTPQALEPLKAFLSFLDNPKDIEQTLLQAIYDCALNGDTTFKWVLQHRASLKPALDLDRFTRQLILNKLTAQGFTLGPDFKFDLQTQLLLTPRAQASLLQVCTPAESKLISTLLTFKTF
ncbi:MAG: hypothetical protein AAGC54_19285 [Cyanobacteria bacterium P01_F01_bin.4]